MAFSFGVSVAISGSPTATEGLPMTDNPNRFNLDDLARQLAQSLPQNLRALGGDLERNFRALLHSGLERMDLVTREEFDVQRAVLERTREKLEALEARLAALEGDLGTRSGTSEAAAESAAPGASSSGSGAGPVADE